jgi:hypothetical protein
VCDLLEEIEETLDIFRYIGRNPTAIERRGQFDLERWVTCKEWLVPVLADVWIISIPSSKDF